MTKLTLAPLALLAVLAPATAAAESFDERAQGAVPVARLDEVAWALTASCEAGSDVQQRQCRRVRDATASRFAGRALILRAEPGAFTMAPYNPAARSMQLTVTSCIACKGLDVDGGAHLVTGGVPAVEGGALAPAMLYDFALPFPSEAEASAFRAGVVDPRVELVVKLPASPRWKVAGKQGLAVEVLAWRVVSPCTGKIVVAKPSSQPARPDKAACPAPPAR